MAFVEGTSTKTNEYFNRLEVDGEDGTEFIDHWDTGELLFLATSVLRSDRNWVSVARSIKPFGEQTRPADWYTPKNCALQYTKLLSEIDEDSKKKTLPRTERETSEALLVKNLTEKRANELAWLNQQTKVTANVLKTYIEMVESGDFDDNLDELLKQIEDREKQEEENFNEYLMRRENLNATKKLNKSRITKGKAASKASESKKKLSISDLAENNPHHAVVEEVINNIKKEMNTSEEYTSPSKPVHIKSEIDTPITLNALLDSKVTLPSSVAPTSPLLTSLLRSIASTTPGSHTLSAVSTSLKESDTIIGAEHSKVEVDTAGLKSRDASPRSSVPQSPRPTPASSPLLNSLLKNTPSSTTPIQISPVKEISPKAISSPQPFFNPTSALATAAVQQLPTSTLPQSLQFFQQHDLSESRKVTLQSSPITSACLSAPTLSKLLEMPPSAPGRLPPLPVLDPPTTLTPVITTVVAPNPVLPVPKPSAVPEIAKTPDTPIESKKVVLKTLVSTQSEPSVLQKSLTSYSHSDKKPATTAIPVDSKVTSSEEESPSKFKGGLDDTSQENIDILEAVCESINQAFEEKEKEEKEEQPLTIDIEKQKEKVDVTIAIPPLKPTVTEKVAESIPSSADVSEKPSITSLATKQKTTPSVNVKPSPESLPATVPIIPDPAFKITDLSDDDKGASSKKFYKSRTTIKKEEVPEKSSETIVLLQSPKKVVHLKVEPKSPAPHVAEVPVVPEEPEIPVKQEPKVTKVTETKSPLAKKPRLYERTSIEKPQELSEDEAPVRRSGRRGKKGRGRSAKNTTLKQSDPKDQYEFTESTEENSVGYQAANTLCYMPRLKEDSRSDDSKPKLSSGQESEEAVSTPTTPTAEKKALASLRNKQGRPAASQQTPARKSLFTSDEERMSDSLTSDEASNHLLSEDKLKKWEETCEKKGEAVKGTSDSIKRSWKGIEIPKKKIQPPKKTSAGKNLPGRKERKLSNVDTEDLSTGSRDSEEVSGTDKDTTDEKDLNAATPIDMEVETNDSRPSSSIAAESDKQIEDVEGGESFQGSITTDFSPPSTSEVKEEKEPPHFGKQDWMHNSPKSSEPVSQSSEESEYESDNWDNQSVSTNKSASHSTGTQPRLKRKERESPEYKAWKKAISIVLREASCHKNANVFLQKVTNDVAPGYLSIVHKPMDLSLIKKNIDNGVVKTTSDFHRDMLLMFQNAIMYNSSDHDVHQMAVEMQRDVIEQIGAFLITQSNSKNAASDPLTCLRGARTAKAQKGPGKQTASSKMKEEAD